LTRTHEVQQVYAKAEQRTEKSKARAEKAQQAQSAEPVGDAERETEEFEVDAVVRQHLANAA
jgi:hypothetical protein